MSTIASMTRHELATTIAELPEIIEQLKSQQLPKHVRVRLIWDDEEVSGVTQKKDIQALMDDLKKLQKPSHEGRKAFEEGQKIFRNTFSL